MTFLLDAYAARSCPWKTVHSFTPGLEPPAAPPRPAFFRDADAIEDEVVARLVASDAHVVDLRATAGRRPDEAVGACLAALRAGADVVVGGRLPPDPRTHRVGRPSLLVRTEEGRAGYHPVQLKYHRVVEACRDDTSLIVSTLASPRTAVELPARRFRWSTRLNAALQIAHEWRVLEAAGLAGEEPWGGLVGIDQLNVAPPGARAQVGPVITWLHLETPAVPPSPRTVPVPADAAPVSVLQRYDAEHSHRVDLALAASTGRASDAPLPVFTAECRGCRWLEHCRTLVPPDDLSARLTKSPLDVHEVQTLRSLGVATVGDLAAAELDALLPAYLPRASHRDGGEARLRRAHRRARMLHAGVEIERRTTGPLPLERHELEVDIDVETSADDRVYLWGFRVDDRATDAAWQQSFATFALLDDAAETALAEEALTWLRRLTAGRDAAVYHYSDYEVLRIQRLAPRFRDASLTAWALEAAATSFVDLFTVVREHFLGANGLGLKVVATAVAGFAWRDPDPGGLNSQTWFAEAVTHPDADVREAARRRVLEYNEDDVLATWHLRRWLRTQG